MKMMRCPLHTRYRGVREPRPKYGKKCWYCVRIFGQRKRAEQAARDEQETRGGQEFLDSLRDEREFLDEFVLTSVLHQQLREDKKKAAERQERGTYPLPPQNLAQNGVRTYCRVIRKPYGSSFVCPWSHASGRRLSRNVALHRAHLDCAYLVISGWGVPDTAP